jgi:hypothetical protein
MFRTFPCRKHVEVCSKNKFEKLVYLVGFIVRIYNDSRSPERRNLTRETRMRSKRARADPLLRTRGRRLRPSDMFDLCILVSWLF